MAKVKITDIKKQYIMSSEDFNYLLQHRGEWLPLMALNFTETGKLWTFAVYARDTCISVFVDDNKVTYEVMYNGDNNN